MKKENIIITALSFGIVVIVGVTAVVLFQSTRKNADVSNDTTAMTTAAARTTTAAASMTAQTAAPVQTLAQETSQPVPTTVPTSAPTPSPASKPAIEDGSYNAFVTSVSMIAPDSKSQGTISLRVAKIYTGAEAIAQAKADKEEYIIEVDEEGVEYIPNDYYISIVDTLLVLPVLSDSSIRVIPPEGPDTSSYDYCMDASLLEFSNNVSEYERFVTITVNGGRVSLISEFYLP